MTDKENFLSRWSRLKREPEPETPATEEDACEAGPAAEAEHVPADAAADADAALADADIDKHPDEPHPAELIDIDSLTKESDFSAFVKKGVPAALQRKALRKLWTLDPVLANLDGLNDYENIIEDFGITDLKPGGSGWQLGRGFMKDKDFALINERGGYKPPEAEEPEEAEVLAEEDDAAEAGARDENVALAREAVDTDAEFDVGGGDEET
ncbi:MAG: DUF3306 domain-containing protein [Rhodobiaceae bacterium]|nr:DUF3306 domain-containing protein [Rhodobiaceae bacterium]MCC0012722.1 DUF3306 domain-containing protein [Rhodobiaceae bacterium]MCC0018393.1 DUF3306 domain-containing protein [Rhodobiaceae bacterium]MCC0060251.1 DUF3306 domain-containing protein [Rhodobiaceae bacterium]